MPDASEGREGNQIPNCSLHRKPVQSQLTVCDTVHYIHNYDYMPRGTMGGWVGGGGGTAIIIFPREWCSCVLTNRNWSVKNKGNFRLCHVVSTLMNLTLDRECETNTQY